MRWLFLLALASCGPAALVGCSSTAPLEARLQEVDDAVAGQARAAQRAARGQALDVQRALRHLGNEVTLEQGKTRETLKTLEAKVRGKAAAAPAPAVTRATVERIERVGITAEDARVLVHRTAQHVGSRLEDATRQGQEELVERFDRHAQKMADLQAAFDAYWAAREAQEDDGLWGVIAALSGAALTYMAGLFRGRRKGEKRWT